MSMLRKYLAIKKHIRNMIELQESALLELDTSDPSIEIPNQEQIDLLINQSKEFFFHNLQIINFGNKLQFIIKPKYSSHRYLEDGEPDYFLLDTLMIFNKERKIQNGFMKMVSCSDKSFKKMFGQMWFEINAERMATAISNEIEILVNEMFRPFMANLILAD